MRRLMLLAATGLLMAACGGTGAPAFTVRPINVPTFSFPPIEMPSGLLPSSNPGTGNCAFVTPAEVSNIMGGTLLTTQDVGNTCSYTFNDGRAVVLLAQDEIDLGASKFLMGNTAKDVTVAGLPAVTGSISTLPAVHVQRGNQQLQVSGAVLGADEATIEKLVQIATLAVSRWP